MALLAQQALHIAASFSSSFPSAVLDSGSSDYTSSCWASQSSASPGMTTNGHYGRRILPQSSTFQELPLQQLQEPDGGLPGSKFVCSCGEPLTKLRRISQRVFPSVSYFRQFHLIGTLGVYCRSSQRRRVERRDGRRDGSGNNSEDETEGIADGQTEKDEETREELSRDEKAQGIEDGHTEKDEETREELSREEKAQGIENKDKQGADKQESQGENGEGNREEADHKKTVVQTEDFKTALWRKFWGLRQNVEDDSLGPEEELMLRDLESLSFNWRALLDPTWENALALSFTALLTVGLLKISFQLVLVAFTILLAALKYTVLAALLLGLLILLL